MKSIYRNIIGCLTALVLSWNTFGQDVESHFACSYYGETVKSHIAVSNADSKAEAVISHIMATVGLKANFEVRAAEVPNAAAVVYGNDRYILYNPRFMNQINYASGTSWAAISILAHEIGHHLNGHTLKKGGSRPDIELEADEFSGFVLYKLGASKEEAQAAMNVAASQRSSHTHPAKRDRLVAIASGWNNAKGQNSGTGGIAASSTKAVVKPVAVKSTPVKQTALDERYIAFDVNFKADSNGKYFITTKGNLVLTDGRSIYVIGRLAESNRRGYKLMLTDKNYNYLYITTSGAVVNAEGEYVGRITSHNATRSFEA